MMTKIVIMFLIQSMTWIRVAAEPFHIRHNMGKCLYTKDYNVAFNNVCRHQFRWKGDTRLIHIPTGKCVRADTQGRIKITSICSGTDSLFQYQAKSHSIKHLLTGKCITSTVEDPAKQTEPSLSPNCNSTRARFWLVAQVYYVIRHFGGLCWVYSESDNLIKLQNSYVCDRFYQQNNLHLKHMKTGKCVILENSYLRLTSVCSKTGTNFNLYQMGFLHRDWNTCVWPSKDAGNPKAGTSLIVKSDCFNSNNNAGKTLFYDDKGVLEVDIVSETCDDGSPNTGCSQKKGHVKVNGYQYSNDGSGINVVVLDYRSGIFENRKVYNLYGDPTLKNSLAKFLNGLPSGKILFMAMKDVVVTDFGTDLIPALQRHGVSATYATNNLAKARCSMATIAYTGKSRKSWEQSVNQPKCNGSSRIQKTIYAFRDFEGLEDCSEEMGMRSGKISSSQLTAKTNWAGCDPFLARLHNSAGCWCSANHSPESDFIQVDFGALRLITGIAIQPHPSDTIIYVKKFVLQYSEDGIVWKYCVDESNAVKYFKGLEGIGTKETFTNWFSRTLLRYIRFVPTDRAHHPCCPSHCVRMELFGCRPKRAIFRASVYSSSDVYIGGARSGQVSFKNISPMHKKIQIGISTAASNTTLTRGVTQQDIRNVSAAITFGNGTLVDKAVEIARWGGEERGITESLKIGLNLDLSEHFDVNINMTIKILDAKRESGMSVWNVYTFEAEDQSLIISRAVKIKRKTKDESQLLLNITNETHTNPHGHEVNVNISVTHSEISSSANAYQVMIFVYYDTSQLTLTSHNSIKKDNQTINPTRSTASPGIIEVYTDTLWLYNKHFISFKFSVNKKQILKNQSVEGVVITDFAYMNNLLNFKGKAKAVLHQHIPYKFDVPEKHKMLPKRPQRIPVPGFSMLYDKQSKNIYICKMRNKHSERNLPFCLMYNYNSNAWREIPYIAAVAGIDSSTGMLFGIDRNGNGYVSLSKDLKTVFHVDDNEWTSIQSKTHVRKAKTAPDVQSLPEVRSSSWKFPSSGYQRWAATRKGISKYGWSVWNLKLCW